MKLSDLFKAGQTVYVVDGGPKPEGSVSEYYVVSVGRKYVKCENDMGNVRDFEMTIEERPYLTEHKDCGHPKLLFSSEIAAAEHVEGNVLRQWISKATDWTRLNRYSVEQLRAVKEILDPDNK